MRELTEEIRIKLREKALLALQDGNELLVIDSRELDEYYQLLCDLYRQNEIEIN